MPFNPVKRMRERHYPGALEKQLSARVHSLAVLPSSVTTPYLSVALDWRPAGSSPETRGALQFFEQEVNRLRQEHWPRGDVYDSLGEDISRITNWLATDLDPATKGVFIVANSGQEVFETIELGLPLENRVTSGPVPSLLQLARLNEDHPTYAVLLADQQNAYIILVSQAHRVDELAMASSDYPRKQQTGGWSQRRFQQRADERILALGRQIASETQAFLDERGVDMVILAGDEVITSVLDRTMAPALKARVVNRIRLDIDATTSDVVAATEPLARQAELDREMASVQSVIDAMYGEDRGVAGSAGVLGALLAGRVSTLVINDDFHEDGWADFANHRYGVGEHRDVFSSVESGFVISPIIVEEEIVRLAIQYDVDLDVIQSTGRYEETETIPDAGVRPRTAAAKMLDQLDGVAATLRY